MDTIAMLGKTTAGAGTERLVRRAAALGLPEQIVPPAAVRLLAVFGDFGPRLVGDADNARYRKLCAAFGVPEEQADRDLALLGAATPVEQTILDTEKMHTALPTGPRPGAFRTAAGDAVLEAQRERDQSWEPRLIPTDQVEPFPDDQNGKEADHETLGTLVQAGEREARSADPAGEVLAELEARGKVANARVEREHKKRPKGEAPTDPVAHAIALRDKLLAASLDLEPTELDLYMSGIRGSHGATASVAAAIAYLVGPKPPTAAANSELIRWNANRASGKRLLSYFGAFTYERLTQHAITGYREVLSAMSYARKPDHPKYFSYTTIQNDLLMLRRAVRDFAQPCQLAWTPTFEIPTERVVRAVFLTRKEVSRLLWATRGRVHDPATGDWLVHEVPVKGRRKWVWDGPAGTDRSGRWETLEEAYPGETMKVRYIDLYKRHRRGLARLIIISVYSGMRHEAAMRLVWSLHDERGHLDPDEGVIYRYGRLTERTRKTMTAPVSWMAPSLASFARIWAKNDKRVLSRLPRQYRDPDQPADCIIRKFNNKPYRVRYLRVAFSSLILAAGLTPEIVVHSLRHTAATWHAVMGTNVRAAAEHLGMSVEVMIRVYAHMTIEGQADAAEMWRDPVARARLKGIEGYVRDRKDKPRLVHAPEPQQPRKVEISKRMEAALAKRAAS